MNRMAQFIDHLDPETESTRTRIARKGVLPDWLRQGQWVLIRRNARFGCVVGEHQQSSRTVFEIVVGTDGTRYLIPLDEAVRALRPIAQAETAEQMLRIIHEPNNAPLPESNVALETLKADQWANTMPESAAALLMACYLQPALRDGNSGHSFARLEQLVLTELQLVLGLDSGRLQHELHLRHGIAEIAPICTNT